MDRKTIRIASSPWVVGYISDYESMPQEDSILDAAKGLTVVVDGVKMKTRDGVFRECATKLSFPSYFGWNWNAFNDCMRDLEWISAQSIVVVIENAGDVLSEGDVDEFGVFMRIILIAGDELNRSDEFRPARAFHVVLHSSGSREDEQRLRLKLLSLVTPAVSGQ